MLPRPQLQAFTVSHEDHCLCHERKTVNVILNLKKITKNRIIEHYRYFFRFGNWGVRTEGFVIILLRLLRILPSG